MHALVDQLCNVMSVEDGAVVIPPSFATMFGDRLRGVYEDEPGVFKDLLVMWAEFDAREFQPAASQLLEMLRLLPVLEDERAALESESKARAFAQFASVRAKPDGLAGKKSLGSVGMRKR